MEDVRVERKSEVQASVSPIYDRGGLVGYRVSFVPPSHSEEEYEIEKALFSSASVTLSRNAGTHEVSFAVRNPTAVAQGRRSAENLKRAREGKPSLEEEEKAKAAASEKQ